MKIEQDPNYKWFTNYYLEREDLEKLHTRVLINMIHASKNSHRNRVNGWINYTWDMGNHWWYNEEMLRDVLKHRPHMPNKKESIAIRKAKIAQNKKKTKCKFIVSLKPQKMSKRQYRIFMEQWGICIIKNN